MYYEGMYGIYGICFRFYPHDQTCQGLHDLDHGKKPAL